MLQRARRSACKDEDGFCSEVEKLIDEYHFEVGAVVSLREEERIQFELFGLRTGCFLQSLQNRS